MTTTAAVTNRPAAATPCNTYDRDEVYAALLRCLEPLGVKAPRGERVLLKPNAVTINRPDQATGTHPAVLDAVCRWLSDAGCTVSVGDSSSYWHPGYTWRSFETLGLAAVAQRYGAELVALEEEPFRTLPAPEGSEVDALYVADLSRWDRVVNLPKLKVHRVTRISGAVKNMFGVVPGGTKQRYHDLLRAFPDYLDRFGALILDVYLAAKPWLNVLDGVVGLERDGPAASGDPRRTRFLMASEDGLALDLALCRLIGEQSGAVTYLREALRRDLVSPDAVELLGDPPTVGFRLLDVPPANVLARHASAAMFRHLLVRPHHDARACEACGHCVERCQVDALRLDGHRVRVDTERCIRCFACPAFCEAGALTLRGSLVNRALQAIRPLTGM